MFTRDRAAERVVGASLGGTHNVQVPMVIKPVPIAAPLE
jgi:hypothetical protein